MAGFRALAAVGRSIEMVLGPPFATEEPVTGRNTCAALVRTNGLDLGRPTRIVLPALSILRYRDSGKSVTTVQLSTMNDAAFDGSPRIRLSVDGSNPAELVLGAPRRAGTDGTFTVAVQR